MASDALGPPDAPPSPPPSCSPASPCSRAGRRPDELAEAVARTVVDDFADRVLAFDLIAAGHYATVVSGRRSIGRPVTTADAQIAACCLSFGATLATRNTTDFAETGVDLVDPWTAMAP